MSLNISEQVVKGEAIESDSDEEIVHDFRENTHTIVSALLFTSCVYVETIQQTINLIY